MASPKMTTISLRAETRDRLRKIGSKDQTYDEVIRELIDRASIKELDARWNRILEGEKFTPLEKL
jgi:predicted CopG family antitoxin